MSIITDCHQNEIESVSTKMTTLNYSLFWVDGVLKQTNQFSAKISAYRVQLMSKLHTKFQVFKSIQNEIVILNNFHSER